MSVSAIRKTAMQSYKEGKTAALKDVVLPVVTDNPEPESKPPYYAIPHSLFQKLEQLLTTYLEDDSVPDDTLLEEFALTVNDVTSESIALDGT